MTLHLKRIYDDPDPGDGYRVLVDRLWPRGVSKERAALDLWAKHAAPSNELRRSWHGDPAGHDPEHFAAFAAAYRAELAAEPAATALAELAELARAHPVVTVLYGARDAQQNHAIVLREALQELLRERPE